MRKIEVSLFGACIVRITGTEDMNITGLKHRALIALLVTAPLGVRTRTFLQETLWGEYSFDSGRQNLRRALSDLRKTLGPAFDDFFTSNNHEVCIDLSKVAFLTSHRDGVFLEGIDLAAKGFKIWLEKSRLNPAEITELVTTGRQTPTPNIAPTIATIPFKLVHGDQEYTLMGDWFAEDISRSLSRSSFLSVISHYSSRSLNASLLETKKIRLKLNADYAIMGSIRIHGGAVFLDIDCIDCASGQLLWTRPFESPLAELHTLRPRVTQQIVSAVGNTIIKETISAVGMRPVADIQGHQLLVAGVALMHRQTLKSFSRGRELIEEAIRRAQNQPELYAWLAKWYILSVFNGWSSDVKRDTQMAVDQTARALDMDPNCSLSLTIDGFAHSNLICDIDTAGERYAQALDLNPNQSLSWLLSGTLNGFKGEAMEGVKQVEHAQLLSPLDPFGYFYDSLRASTHLANDNYEHALTLARKSYAKNKRHTSTLRVQIAALHGLGRHDESRKVAHELLGNQPDFSVSTYMATHPAANFPIGQRMATALRNSGIPE